MPGHACPERGVIGVLGRIEGCAENPPGLPIPVLRLAAAEQGWPLG